MVTFAAAEATAGQLDWDNDHKTVAVPSSETSASAIFWATNVSSRPITIVRVKPSCGCTTATNTRLPLILAPGRAQPIRLDTDVRGKRGILNKTAQVFSSSGVQVLKFKLAIGLEEQAMSRRRNVVLAEADRQAVFRNDCAECHTKPTIGKSGRALFTAACGICHERKAQFVNAGVSPEQSRATDN